MSLLAVCRGRSAGSSRCDVRSPREILLGRDRDNVVWSHGRCRGLRRNLPVEQGGSGLWALSGHLFGGCHRFVTWLGVSTPVGRARWPWLGSGHDRLARADAFPGARHLHSGKVRDLYRLARRATLLMVASDRISAYDCVLRHHRSPTRARCSPRCRCGGSTSSPTSSRTTCSRTDVPAAVRGPRGRLRAAADVPGRVRRPRLPHRLRAWSSTAATGAVCGIALPAGLRGRQPAARADLHPATKAASATTTRTSSYDAVVGSRRRRRGRASCAT